jgi:chromosome segregation ATPase
MEYQNRQDLIHDLARQIEELLKDNELLKQQLEQSDSEKAKFQVQVMQLENGQIELIAKLEDSQSEVGRLGMVLKHQTQNRGGPVWLDRMFHVLSESPCDSV